MGIINMIIFIMAQTAKWAIFVSFRLKITM